MARRDEILDFAAELLDLASFRDYGPQGMQVAGAEEVSKIVCAVSSSLELFERAAEAGAQLVVVHHGMLWDNESRVIDARVRRRLEALFDARSDARRLPPRARRASGGRQQRAARARARRRGRRAVRRDRRRRPAARTEPREAFLARVRERITPEPLVFADGPDAGRARRDRLRRRRPPPRRGGRGGLRPVPDRRAGRAEPAPRARARDHVRRRRPLRDRAARRPGAGRRGSPSASASSGSSSSSRTPFEHVGPGEYSLK